MSKPLSIQKNDVIDIFHIFIRFRFQGYRCKSEVAILHKGSLKITHTVPLRLETGWSKVRHSF